MRNLDPVLSRYFTLRSVTQGTEYPINEIRYRDNHNGLLELSLNTGLLRKSISRSRLEERYKTAEWPYLSGVWRYHEFLLPVHTRDIITKPEGNTNLYPVGASEQNGFRKVGEYAGIDRLYLKHEGENPTGSFKDRGMTTGMTMAHLYDAPAVACASTGNTSAALASYAALAGKKAFVFIPEGKIAFGKLSQSLAYGAVTIQINGDFDMAMKLVEEVCNKRSIYLLNSVNPFRIEGQKTIAFEIIQQRNWEVPDWIVVPAGNLGNTSAIGKGLKEMYETGLIDRIPRIASIQTEGSNPFYLSYQDNFINQYTVTAETIATAIKIGNPVSYEKAKQVILDTDGVVSQVSDQEIVDAKAQVDAAGIGCEPASAASVAGLKKLVSEGVIKSTETVCCVLTGHVLKDPDTTVSYHMKTLKGLQSTFASSIHTVDPTYTSVEKIIGKILANRI